MKLSNLGHKIGRFLIPHRLIAAKQARLHERLQADLDQHIDAFHNDRGSGIDEIRARVRHAHDQAYTNVHNVLRTQGVAKPHSFAKPYARFAADVEGKKIVAQIDRRLKAEVAYIRAKTEWKLAKLDVRAANRAFGVGSKAANVAAAKLAETERRLMKASAVLAATPAA